MRVIAGLWRWRRNPLRRRTDVAEAWAALLAAVCIALGAPTVGVTVGSAVQDTLLRWVHEQQQERHLVTATVVRRIPHPPIDPDPETSSARDAHHRVVAAWTAPDGTARSGPAITPRATTPGDRFRVWTDARGRLVPRPLDRTTANSHAALAGGGAAVAAAGLVEAGRRLVVWRLMHRRYGQWDRAWERAGQDWGRTGTGS
ncbi:Rv1733c family protein [Streptomyces sp. 8N706]|uniref:Rv1733c family protein n=1 Tax=Streptomyces sp. 8N706 TaxID=3457416 RepID=UPI003FD3ADFC